MAPIRPPWYAQVVAIALRGLGIFALVGFAIDLPTAGMSSSATGGIALALVMLMAGWWLYRGVVWGYVLGIALGLFLLTGGVLGLLSTSYDGPTWLLVWLLVLPGLVITAALVTPRSFAWFRRAWETRANQPTIP